MSLQSNSSCEPEGWIIWIGLDFPNWKHKINNKQNIYKILLKQGIFFTYIYKILPEILQINEEKKMRKVFKNYLMIKLKFLLAMNNGRVIRGHYVHKEETWKCSKDIMNSVNI